MKNRRLLKVSEAAKLLRTSASSVRRLCKAGDLECLRHPNNRYRLIDRESLDRFKAQGVSWRLGRLEREVLPAETFCRLTPRTRKEVAIQDWVESQRSFFGKAAIVMQDPQKTVYTENRTA